MTKADLKTGMRVELRSGTVMTVLTNVENGDDVITDALEHIQLLSYNDDFSNNMNISACDIMKIYSCPKVPWENYIKSKEKGKLIWERKKEPEEMTLEEVCKALGKDVKIVKG